MLEKLLLFGAGYVLGARAGKERLDQLVGFGKELSQRDEFKMVVNLARGFVEERVGSAGSTERWAA